MIVELKIGQLITPIRTIDGVMISHWVYSKECADIGGGLLPGAELRIVEISKMPGSMWVCAELPGRYPPATLKIAGEEYALNFRVLR